MDIKSLTAEHHKTAENQEFVKTIMSGNINPELYGTYIFNLLQCYSLLEKYCSENGLFRDLPSIERSIKLKKDYEILWPRQEKPPYITDSVLRYIYHLDSIKNEPEKLFAHVYVRHMGDLYGGQMIRKKTPGANTYLVFQKPEQLKAKIRELIYNYVITYQINVVAEARLCFEYATELFKEMNDLGKSYTVQK